MTHLLHIDCPDEPGLVFRITQVLFEHGFNIISNQEFVDQSTQYFFMRTAFAGDRPPQVVVDQLRQRLSPATTVRLATAGKRPIVLMATKESHCLGDLLLRHADGELNADIQAVISNHAVLEPLVNRFDIPFHHVPATHDRAAHERGVLALLEQYRPDYLVLAKYMRILSPEFVARYPFRILNIHHSFLPAFVGARPYHQAFERGVKIIGATAHAVTNDLDTGPIIAQDVLPVTHTHTAASMAQAGRDIEKLVLARALKLLLEERVFFHHNRTVVFE
ncbi:formyltetrahydrofolate deformylase [Catalinimonas alkaloidigena]|uniref:Formyltetrahydrofolate deformylase n=1 Tax=Catalinimonas alkaloidigena TaxID=1075417 RepID=A0A1G9R4G5_9BACT|nr:formyltetrahydrofolate deformylase [Catalinimonas alkaloidigena]SDM18169.1 formyltetrahydrofolate deformylase [Catalinimonas alkaloidigena]